MRFIKLSSQTIFAGIVVVMSVIMSLLYTFLLYPFRIILVENKRLICNKGIPFRKRLWKNPYYIFHQIKERNNSQQIKFQEKESDFTIFIKIKNKVAFIPSTLYSILLYPIDFIILLLSVIFIR